MPFAIVAVLGLVGGAVLDIYSSGLALLTARRPGPAATWPPLIDGVIMVLGTIYVVFIADNFIGPFQGFLITLGVPIAAWCGVMLADIALRRRDYAERRAVRPARPLRRRPVAAASRLVVLGTVLGWGLVTNAPGRLADLAGLPARAVRPRRQGRRLGVREPRRARRAGGRVARHAADGARADPGAGGGPSDGAHGGDCTGDALRADGGADRAGQPVGRARRGDRNSDGSVSSSSITTGAGRAGQQVDPGVEQPRRPARHGGQRPLPPPPARPRTARRAMTSSGRNSPSVSADVARAAASRPCGSAWLYPPPT